MTRFTYDQYIACRRGLERTISEAQTNGVRSTEYAATQALEVLLLEELLPGGFLTDRPRSTTAV
jgi:hypothetical protein